MRILIVEDDKVLLSNLIKLLEHNHYQVTGVNTSQEALVQASSGDFDMIILDWMLPDSSGIEICKTIREDEDPIPILILTARTSTDDVVTGLESGADDYLKKPFRYEELIARIQTLLRRKSQEYLNPSTNIGIIDIDSNNRTVTVEGKNIDLSPREFDLLEYLARNKNTTLSRISLLGHVWGGSIDELSNTVDVHVRYLRKKLGKKAATQIKTIKGVGYSLCED